MIKKRGNRWWVVVYAGRDPLTGRKRQKTGTAATKAQARQLEARLISEVGAGQHGGAAGKTVADLLEAWFQWRPSVRPISPNTLVNYRRYADQKLLPALGRLPLNRWTLPPSIASTLSCVSAAAKASTATGACATASRRCVPAKYSG